jgi:hypothetical protein
VKYVRVARWVSLALFLFFLAYVPWGWTATVAVVTSLVLVQAQRVLSAPPARHASVRHSSGSRLARSGRHAA